MRAHAEEADAVSARSPGAARVSAGARARGWAGPLLVTAFGGWLRFDQLSTPRAVVFDETYYVPQAYGILRYGAEHAVSIFTNTLIPAGQTTNIFVDGGIFAAHPPFGKIQIAAGEWLYGLNPFGWRFAVALAGTVSILMLARIARRMTGSDLLGTIAGLLLALDGLEFVMSRTAMLDIFVMLWALAGFGCLLLDRDRLAARLAARSPDPPGEPDAGQPDAGQPERDGPGPRLGVRWWRIAAGICLGLATASKWNGLYFLVVFVPLCAWWDVAARRAAGFRGHIRGAIVRDGPATLASLWLAAALAYLATWSGWFGSSIGWDRNYAAAHGVHIPIISALYSLYEYHLQMLSYNVGLHQPDTYQSQPWTWLALNHPVPFYYATLQYGLQGCGQLGGCVQYVLAVGTPAIWWASIAAIPVLAAWALWRSAGRWGRVGRWGSVGRWGRVGRRGDAWAAGAALTGLAAGWLPWFAFPARTQFFYYAVSFEPFLILTLTLCLGLIIGPAGASLWRRVPGMMVTAGYLVVVALNFGYLYPVLTGSPISDPAWLARMWMHSWM
jgi:dolichyl-phosphate-mannose-protein mannosyltransferase